MNHIGDSTDLELTWHSVCPLVRQSIRLSVCWSVLVQVAPCWSVLVRVGLYWSVLVRVDPCRSVSVRVGPFVYLFVSPSIYLSFPLFFLTQNSNLECHLIFTSDMGWGLLPPKTVIAESFLLLYISARMDEDFNHLWHMSRRLMYVCQPVRSFFDPLFQTGYSLINFRNCLFYHFII